MSNLDIAFQLSKIVERLDKLIELQKTAMASGVPVKTVQHKSVRDLNPWHPVNYWQHRRSDTGEFVNDVFKLHPKTPLMVGMNNGNALKTHIAEEVDWHNPNVTSYIILGAGL